MQASLVVAVLTMMMMMMMMMMMEMMGCVTPGVDGDGPPLFTKSPKKSGEGAPDTPPPSDPPSTGAPTTQVGCAPSMTMSSGFAMTLGDWTPFATNAPPPTAGAPMIGAILLPPPQVNADGTPKLFFGASSSLWSRTAPLVSFDVDFEVQLTCPQTAACGDGFAFSWIDAESPTALTQITNTGSSLGVPTGLAGAAIAIDLFENPQRGDKATPALEILSLDATKPAAEDYLWTLATKSTPLPSGWHKVHVKNRDGVIALTYDGAPDTKPLAVTGTVGRLTRGVVGLSASTGAATETVSVRNFRGEFYDCIAP